MLLTAYGPIDSVLVERLKQYDYPYVVVTSDTDEAQQLHSEGVRVVVRPLDDPETYRKARADKAALIGTVESENKFLQTFT